VRISLPFLTLILSLHISLQAPAQAVEISGGPTDYQQKFKALGPGDTLNLAAGEYRRGLMIKNRHGQKDKWITIQGQGKKTVFVGRKGSNTIDILQSSYIAIKNIQFDGKGLEVDAIKAGRGKAEPCHHILIQDTIILNHGAHQNIVGINTKGPCWDWIIRGNTIIGAGTGLYLGNSDGKQPFIRGIIEYNLIKNPVGYCMQIKHQLSRPDLPGIPASPSSTVIRYNSFIKGDGPSSAGDRPNLLVGGFPNTGPGSKDRYQIYGNLLYHNPRESLFQGTGDLSIHDNIFVDCQKSGINVRSHNKQDPKRVKIYHNTFFEVAKPIKISHLPKSAPKLSAHNLILSLKAQSFQKSDTGAFGKNLKRAIAQPSLEFGVMDFQPRGKFSPQKKLTRVALKKWLQNDIDSTLDFFRQKKKSLSHSGAISLKFKKRRPIQEKNPRSAKEP
jgi:hypothetical protein